MEEETRDGRVNDPKNKQSFELFRANIPNVAISPEVILSEARPVAHRPALPSCLPPPLSELGALKIESLLCVDAVSEGGG